MKKVLLITWTFAIVIALFFFLKYLITERDGTKIIPQDENIMEKCTEIFSVHTFDSLMSSNEYVLLTLAFGDCSVCDAFRANQIPDRFPVARYYIDATYDNTNMLVLQALYFTGFPLSYVIDQNYNVIGNIQGLAYLGERLDSIIYGKHELQPKTFEGFRKTRHILC